MGGFHSTGRPETGTLRAIFIAPTKALIFLPFTTQRTTAFTVTEQMEVLYGT